MKAHVLKGIFNIAYRQHLDSGKSGTVTRRELTIVCSITPVYYSGIVKGTPVKHSNKTATNSIGEKQGFGQ